MNAYNEIMSEMFSLLEYLTRHITIMRFCHPISSSRLLWHSDVTCVSQECSVNLTLNVTKVLVMNPDGMSIKQ